MGEEIKKEKVAPKGKPAETNPIKIGMEEQEQKGVKIPNKAPRRLPLIPLIPPSNFLVLSGGKYDWM
jgi:hypothetical protein